MSGLAPTPLALRQVRRVEWGLLFARSLRHAKE